MTTKFATIQQRRGTAAEWTTADPVLAAGEFGVETDTGEFKVGDGETPWTSLSYAGGGSSFIPSGGRMLSAVGTVVDISASVASMGWPAAFTFLWVDGLTINLPDPDTAPRFSIVILYGGSGTLAAPSFTVDGGGTAAASLQTPDVSAGGYSLSMVPLSSIVHGVVAHYAYTVQPAAITYTPGDSGDWDGDPTSIFNALDRLAAAVSGLLSNPVP